jgi:hypothetical protein
MNITIIVKDKLQNVCRMRVKVKMKENGGIIMDKLLGDGRMTAKSKLQGYGRMIAKRKLQGWALSYILVVIYGGSFRVQETHTIFI